ncbi:hypothetical protein Agub_g12154 [Astrephomene gubernaculifera]|uniref:Pherophorin domain-containing protein n=1 Tax=Astrephomene gubernaculifera TaxID=47775 RepID=A0AAD3DXR6_9CHLO|nr:hypothetical protein Agub_g12154 [Astrephomene gubernaculifera]
MCVVWNRTNGVIDKSVCDNFAATILSYAKAQGYSSMSKAFACTAFDSSSATVCGAFKSEADARGFGTFMQNPAGFPVVAAVIGFGNIVAPVNGVMVCQKSILSFVITDMSGKICDSGVFTQDCAPPPQDGFPYCSCDTGATIKTPYAVSYSRKFTRSGNNFYCFKVAVNKAQCGSARCCNMELDKIEWMSDEDNCLSAVDGWTVSTQPNNYRAPVWTRATDTVMYKNATQLVGVLKTNNLNLDASNAGGVEICIALKGTSKCSTMESFCYGGICKYAVFDRTSGNGCCAKDYAPGNSFGSYNRR